MTDITSGSAPFVASDLAAVKSALDGIDVSAAKVSNSITKAFSGAVVSGKSFEQTLQTIGLSLTRMALNAGLQPLQSGLTSLVGSMFSGFGGGVTPFADGGIVSRPTYFGSSAGPGIMGERGAEAILPLARDSNGRLGIAANGGAAGPQVTVNITTPDVDGFRRSQVQVAGALARAVARGQRAL